MLLLRQSEENLVYTSDKHLSSLCFSIITADSKPKDAFETMCLETENPLVQNQFYSSSFTCCLKGILQYNSNHKFPLVHRIHRNQMNHLGVWAFVLTIRFFFFVQESDLQWAALQSFCIETLQATLENPQNHFISRWISELKVKLKLLEFLAFYICVMVIYLVIPERRTILTFFFSFCFN